MCHLGEQRMVACGGGEVRDAERQLMSLQN